MVSKRRVILGAAAATAALILAAKKMHEKGYDRKAVGLLKKYAIKIACEADKLEKNLAADAKKGNRNKKRKK